MRELDNEFLQELRDNAAQVRDDAFLRALAHRLQAERCATASSAGR
jgi:hypothetical protein